MDAFELWLLEKPLESPLDRKEIQPVHPKGNQSWTFIGRTDVEAETPILWLHDANTWLIWKDPDDGKDWRWEEKGMMMASLTQWTWAWVSSWSGWCTGKPGMLQSTRSQRVEHNWATKLNWSSRRQEITNAGKDVDKREPLCTVCGGVNWLSPYRKHYGGFQKLKELLYDPEIYFWIYSQKKWK